METLKVSFSHYCFISYLRRNSRGDFSSCIWWKHKYTNKHIKYAFISLGFVLSQWRTMLLTNRKQVTNKLRGSRICTWCSSDNSGGRGSSVHFTRFDFMVAVCCWETRMKTFLKEWVYDNFRTMDKPPELCESSFATSRGTPYQSCCRTRGQQVFHFYQCMLSLGSARLLHILCRLLAPIILLAEDPFGFLVECKLTSFHKDGT